MVSIVMRLFTAAFHTTRLRYAIHPLHFFVLTLVYEFELFLPSYLVRSICISLWFLAHNS
jgi:hypothetical protein